MSGLTIACVAYACACMGFCLGFIACALLCRPGSGTGGYQPTATDGIASPPGSP